MNISTFQQAFKIINFVISSSKKKGNLFIKHWVNYFIHVSNIMIIWYYFATSTKVHGISSDHKLERLTLCDLNEITGLKMENMLGWVREVVCIGLHLTGLVVQENKHGFKSMVWLVRFWFLYQYGSWPSVEVWNEKLRKEWLGRGG